MAIDAIASEHDFAGGEQTLVPLPISLAKSVANNGRTLVLPDVHI